MLLGLAAGCADVSGPATDMTRTPAVVTWMEWPAEIAFPGNTSPAVRLIGFRSGCGVFRIDVTVSAYNLVALQPYEEIAAGSPCPLYDIIGIYDTLLALPALPAATPRTPFLLTAPTWDFFGGVTDRLFGDFTLVAQVGDTTLRVGGRAELVADSAGCSWAYAQWSYQPGRVMVLDTAIALGAPRRFAFVRGALLPHSPPRCGQSLALRVDGALIEYPWHQSHHPSANQARRRAQRNSSHSAPVRSRAVK
jgi:hypothetical protein